VHRLRVRLHAQDPEQNCGAGKSDIITVRFAGSSALVMSAYWGTDAVKCSLRGFPGVTDAVEKGLAISGEQ
jgi:hypothetical protein